MVDSNGQNWRRIISNADYITLDLTHSAWIADGILPSFRNGRLPVSNVLDRGLVGVRAIYFVLSSESQLLYVGRTINLWQRLDQHRRSRKFKRHNFADCQVAYAKVENEIDLVGEKFLIHWLCPPLNRVLPIIDPENAAACVCCGLPPSPRSHDFDCFIDERGVFTHPILLDAATKNAQG